MLTVGQLKSQLNNYSDDTQVFADGEDAYESVFEVYKKGENKDAGNTPVAIVVVPQSFVDEEILNEQRQNVQDNSART